MASEPERRRAKDWKVSDAVIERLLRHAESGRKLQEEVERAVRERISRGEVLPDPPDFDWSMAAGVPRWKTREEADQALRDALRQLRGDGPGRMAVETRLKAAYGRAKEFELDGRGWHAWILRCHAHRVQKSTRGGA